MKQGLMALALLLAAGTAHAAVNDCTDNNGLHLCKKIDGSTEAYWNFEALNDHEYTVSSKIFMPKQPTFGYNAIATGELQINCRDKQSKLLSVKMVTDGLDQDHFAEQFNKEGINTITSFSETDELSVLCQRLKANASKGE